MNRLLDPKNDYVFKRLFADDPPLLADLINAVRHRAAPITGLRVRNPTIDAAELQGKYIILEMRDADTPAVTLGQEMALHLVEMKKADCIRGRLPGPLAAWIGLFEHWQEDPLMATITHDPVRKARDKLKKFEREIEKGLFRT